jgi:hypothetical protein
MRRLRKDSTKVWHNPDINTFSKRGGSPESAPARPPETAEDRRTAKQHRAALEALFSRKEPESSEPAKKAGSSKPPSRIVLPTVPNADPKTAERQKLLGRLLNAEGRPGVSKAADDFLRAGFTFPEEQDVFLQLLEHTNEDHVRSALDALTSILAGELPKRRAVLESRLRRIEQFAEEPSTRAAAERLRRRVSGRGDAPSAPSTPQ